ncbi:ABC transporter ATP-binding protein [Aneurinibacillus sp. REN35]|uniref:ABC transporter ATP-binding protein n=1 Tax=Aneurinibacillus sp. REN35 TaxID=3237286 RepID=UPI003528C0CB
MTNDELIRVDGLQKHFAMSQNTLSRLLSKEKSTVKAVDGLSFYVHKGETLGIVGESGCGKSTMGRLLLRLLEPTAGRIFFNGEDITRIKGRELNRRRKHFQMVFQDPYASLNPRMTIQRIMEEPMETHSLYQGERDHKVQELLEAVGLPASYRSRYPHEFSGGQRQRIGIARALAVEPEFIIADEPVAALDVSIQAQILNLFADLQKERGLTYLFIAHDLSVVQYISTRVGVMYLGGLVELAPSDVLYDRPLHPYTQALLSAIPIPDPTVRRERITLHGEMPSPMNPPQGCRFHTRCPIAMEECRQKTPVFREVEPNHFVACHVV